MPKIQRFTAIALAIFVIVMLFILTVGIDFQDTSSFNTIFKKNPGLFWGATTIVLVAFFVIKYAETTYALEVKHWLEKLDTKNILIEGLNKTITNQNKTIIANQQKDLNLQEKHIKKVSILNTLIMERAEKDNKKAAAINQIHSKINTLTKKRDGEMKEMKEDILHIRNLSNKNGKAITEILKKEEVK